MTITEFREYCEVLGRFASSRERKEPGPKNTATHKHSTYPINWEYDEDGNVSETRPTLFACKGCSKLWLAKDINRQFDPTDSVLVQASKGRLKFVAGTADSTIVVDAGETEGEGKLLVSPRLLLNAAKTLRGKGTVSLVSNPSSVVIRVSTGAEVELPSLPIKQPGWVRPAKSHGGEVHFDAGWMRDAARLMLATSGNFWPWSHVYVTTGMDGMTLSASDNYTYCEMVLPGDLTSLSAFGSVSVLFFGALKDFGGQGVIRWSKSRLTVESGPYVATTRLYEAPGAQSPTVKEPTAWVEDVDKKVLTDMVKGVASIDEYNRVTLVVRSDSLTVSSYSPSGRSTASVKVPTMARGQGAVAVDAALLGRVLAGYPGKTVTLGWATGSPIQFLNGEWPWRTLVAPIALT